jgi:hypothetical protein
MLEIAIELSEWRLTTGRTTERLGSNPAKVKPCQPLIQLLWDNFLEVNAAQTQRWPLIDCADVKETWICAPTFPYAFMA